MLTLFTFLFVVCGLAFTQFSGVQQQRTSIAIIAIVVFSVVYVIELAKSRRLRPVALPLLLGYCFRLFLVFWDIYGRNIYGLPSSGNDTEMFYLSAVQFARGGGAGHGGAFSELIGTFFSWVGISRLLGQFLIMLFSVVALHLLVRIMEEGGVDAPKRKLVMYIACLLPNFAVLSSIFLRESVVTMLVAASLFYFMRWWNRGKQGLFLLSFVLAFCASLFHSGVVALAAGYIVVRLLYNRKAGRFGLSARNILIAVLFLAVFVYLYMNYADVLFKKMADIESIEEIASGAGRGGASYAAYVGNSDSVFNMIVYSPIRIIYFLFSPLPWHWRGISDVIAFCFSSVFYLIAIIKAFSVLKYKNNPKRNLVLALLILVLCTALVFAWGVSNAGTALRHRDKMVVLYCVLLGLSMSVERGEKAVPSRRARKSRMRIRIR